MPLFSAAVAAVSAAVAWIGTLSAGALMALQTAVSVGISLLAQALAGKPKEPAFPINGKIRGGGTLPRSFMLGRQVTAGSLVWINSWGKDGDTDNAYVTYVIALSDLPIQSVDELWVNGENAELTQTEFVQSVGDGNSLGAAAVAALKAALGVDSGSPILTWNHAEVQTFLQNYILSNAGTYTVNAEQSERGFPVAKYRKDGDDHLWVKFYDGTQTTADPFLRTTASNSNRTWDSNRIGRGVAYAIVTVRNKRNMFSGFPEFKFVITGSKLYDISKDTTMGGDGPHRWGDPSTWGGDGDHLPAVQAYNLLRGVTWGGEWLYGLQGVSEVMLPAENWIAAINKCREPIAKTGGGTEPTYRSAAEVEVDTPIGEALDALMTACQGRISETGGIYRIFLGAPDSPTFSITDDDIISSEEQSFIPFFGLDDSINGINASYPSPKEGWEMVTAPPLYRTDLEAKHGNRRLMADVQLPFVPYVEQVQRLMKFALAEAQRARRHTFTLPPKYWAYAVPGAYFNWTSERNGYSSKLFRIDGVSDKSNLDILIDVTEVDPSDYSWDTNEDFIVPVDGSVGIISPQPQPIVDWSASASTVTGDDGKEAPAIKLNWDPTRDMVAGIEYQVRLFNTQEVVLTGSTPSFDSGSLLISHNIFSNTRYEVRGQYIPDPEAPWDPLWSGWLVVVTPNIQNNDLTVRLNMFGQDAAGILSELITISNEFQHRLELLALDVAEGLGEISDTRSVGRNYQNATASALSELTASISSLNGSLIAQAAITDALQASVGDTTSGIIWRMVAEAGSGNVIARVVLQLRTSGSSETWQTVGTVWEVGETGGNPFGQILLQADKVVIATNVDGDNAVVPFAVDGTDVLINNLIVKNINAQNIQVAGVETESIALNAVTYPYIEEFAAYGPVNGNASTSLSNIFLGPVVDIQSGFIFGTATINRTDTLGTGGGFPATRVGVWDVAAAAYLPNALAGKNDIIGANWTWGQIVSLPFLFNPTVPGEYRFDVFCGLSTNQGNITMEIHSAAIGLLHAMR